MNKALAILNMYPQADPLLDFMVQDEGNGQYIALWNVKDSTGQAVPQPTDDELATHWLEHLKAERIAEFNTKCNLTIVSGFQSSALGVAHTYPSDPEAQNNLTMSLKRLEDPTVTSVNFKTLDAGYLAHTKDQLTKVFYDGFDFGNAQITHYNQLKASVMAATTEDAVNAVAW